MKKPCPRCLGSKTERAVDFVLVTCSKCDGVGEVEVPGDIGIYRAVPPPLPGLRRMSAPALAPPPRVPRPSPFPAPTSGVAPRPARPASVPVAEYTPIPIPPPRAPRRGRSPFPQCAAADDYEVSSDEVPTIPEDRETYTDCPLCATCVECKGKHLIPNSRRLFLAGQLPKATTPPGRRE